MSTAHEAPVAPIALQPGEGEARWFLGFLLTIKASAEATGGRVTVIDHYGAEGPGAPLHVHRNEDEWFFVNEGELTFWIDGTVIVAPAGAFVFGPRGVPHTFSITSPTARFLLVCEPAGFEGFVREMSEPAATLTLPPPPSAPPDLGHLTEVAGRYGIEILGPPGIPS